MPLIILGPIVEEASGSMGGTTFSRNRYGAYARSRTTPVNPSSTRQQTIRSIFQATAALWLNGLSAAQRTAWNLYGSSVVMKNALGQDIYLTGFNHWMRSDVARTLCGAADVYDGPTTFLLPTTDPSLTPAVSEATQQISVVFNTNLDWVDEDDAFLMVSMSSPRPASRSFVQGPFRYAGVIEGDLAAPPASPQVIAVPFAVAQGQRVTIEARIGRADGRLSEPFQATVDVAA